jgi:catechol O-methyltransferase
LHRRGQRRHARCVILIVRNKGCALISGCTGNPAYLSYIRASPEAKVRSLAKGVLEATPEFHANCETKEEWQSGFRDGPLDETRWVPPDSEGIVGKGNPRLNYEGYMLDDVHEMGGWDACEVSICQGEEKFYIST